MRVGLIAIQHESNTFITSPTTLDVYKRCVFAVGPDQVRAALGDSHHEVGGMIEGMDKAGIEVVPILAAQATPGGAVAADALDTFIEIALKGIDDLGPFDGLLVAPHGAGVSEKHRDMDGYWLSMVREKVGPSMPIICTLDPHANVSQKMVDACNAITLYRTNPHIDQKQRGLEAADIMARTLRGEIKPTVAAALPRIAINIERQFTPDAPCKPMYDLANEILSRPGVVSNSVILGFPYADVAEMGSGFIVVTDNDPKLARQYADELAAYLHTHREEFVGQFIEPEDAVANALQLTGPVCLLDMGDNVGGGSPADGTHIAHAITKAQATKPIRAFTAICDPDVVEQATKAGVGATIDLAIGGKTDRLHGEPIRDRFAVRGLFDGNFSESQPRHGGRTRYAMGPTAIVETASGLAVQVTTHRIPPFSIQQIRSCNLDPATFKLLIAKGVNAPVAAYREVCDHFIRVNTAGSTCADMNKFTYEHRRRPLFPLEPI